MGEPIPILGGLFRMYLHEISDNQVSRVLGETHVWEEYSTQIVRENLKPGQTFVDAGANIGYYTLLAAKLVGPEGKVYAFEPNKSNYEVLLKNIALNGCMNVESCMAPLWNEPNLEMTVQGVNDNMGDINIYPAHANDPVDLQRVFSFTLDELFLPNTVDFVKVDCQAADMNVLLGGKLLLTESTKEMQLIVESPAGIPESFGFPLIQHTADYNTYYVRKGTTP